VPPVVPEILALARHEVFTPVFGCRVPRGVNIDVEFFNLIV
jgi:hypothetical protein